MNLTRNGYPRIVVTGMGAVSPLGDALQMWKGLIEGKSGIQLIQADWREHIPVKIAGVVGQLETSPYIPSKELRRIPRVSQFAIVAAYMAAQSALLPMQDNRINVDTERYSVVIGTTMGAHLLAEQMTTEYRRNGHKRPNPIAFANCLPNMPSHHVSRYLGIVGGQHSPIAACATGTQALGDAASLIRMKRADVVFVGGTEAIVMDYIIAGFASMSALAEGYDDQPQLASRPFDAQRNGFVLSEGCGILVFERLEHAIERNAPILAELLGYGSAGDAYHIAAIDPEARGMQRSMRWALTDAHCSPEEIQYVNAHGTGTPQNDMLETLALKQVLGTHAAKIPVSSNKSMLGHTMAACGTLEAIASIYTLQTGIVPPTINYSTPDPQCDLDYVPNNARTYPKIERVLSSNFGLGGQNASVVLGRWQDV